MPIWKPTYKIRRSTRVLSFAERQNFSLLEQAGEACYLLKRLRRADASFQLSSRRVSTITETASSYSVDPDTGALRYLLWEEDRDPAGRFPDIGVFTCTIQSSGSTDAWEPAVDKYTFVSGRKEYAFDIFQDQVDSGGNDIKDAVYIVFNTPPFHASDIATFVYGLINPLTDFNNMQPYRDDQDPHRRSLFGFEQWYSANARVRRKKKPHRFLVAFPGTLTDIVLNEAGFIRQSKRDYWTTAPPYSPTIVEHDIIVRESTGQRFQVVDYTPIYIEDILVSQHFTLAELDPRSTVYDVEIVST